MTDLQTAAGRALLAAPWMLLPGAPLMADMVTAIEAEAAAAALSAARAKVEAVVLLPSDRTDYFEGAADWRQRALAAIDELAALEGEDHD